MVQALQAQPEILLTVEMVTSAVKHIKQHGHDSKKAMSSIQACQQA